MKNVSKSAYVPVNFHPCPDHQIDRPPCWVQQINSDDFSKSNDSNEARAVDVSISLIFGDRCCLTSFQK